MRYLKFIPRVSGKIERLGLIWFINNLAYAFVGSVFAIYLNSFLHNDSYVGFVFTFMTIVAIFANLFIIPVIESRSKAKIFAYSCFLMGIGYLLYSIVNNVWLFISIAGVISIIGALKIAAGGLLIEHLSDKKSLSRTEGIMYTLFNLAWVIGPLIVGFILEEVDVIRNIFMIAAIGMILSSIMIGLFNINYAGIKKKLDGHPLKNLKNYLKDKNRVKNYFLSAGITLWWSLIFVYMPLLIVKNLSDYHVGFFLFFAMLPLVILQYYIGTWAGKHGYKRVFMLGFLIPAIIAAIGFFYTSNIWVMMILMCVSSIGLAMTEATTESYFFDILKDGEDQKFYSLYNTAIDIGALAGDLIPAMILLVLPFRSIFLFYAACMFALFIVSATIKDVVEAKRKGKFK